MKTIHAEDDAQTHESYEADLSALLDGELPRAELLPTLDYLVRSRRARDFYTRSRGLSGLLEASETKPGPTEPEAAPPLWPQIRRRAGLGGKILAFPERLPAWTWRAAAVLVLAMGLWSLGGWLPELTTGPNASLDAVRVVQVSLGDEAGKMTDERFVDLTTEILRSDDHYRAKMLEIMSQVADTSTAVEATTQDPWDHTTYGDEEPNTQPPALW